jgi:hypothetical protein
MTYKLRSIVFGYHNTTYSILGHSNFGDLKLHNRSNLRQMPKHVCLLFVLAKLVFLLLLLKGYF